MRYSSNIKRILLMQYIQYSNITRLVDSIITFFTGIHSEPWKSSQEWQLCDKSFANLIRPCRHPRVELVGEGKVARVGVFVGAVDPVHRDLGRKGLVVIMSVFFCFFLMGSALSHWRERRKGQTETDRETERHQICIRHIPEVYVYYKYMYQIYL